MREFDVEKDAPKFGPSGSKVASVTIQTSRHDDLHHFLRPTMPSKVVTEWDDNDVASERELSDEEYAAAMASYEEALAEWNRTCGMYYTAGPVRIDARIECEDKSTAKGYWVDGEWIWTEWSETFP